MAFNVTEFRANMLGDGARPNLFQVNLTFPAVANAAVAGQRLTFMAKAAQLPGSTVGTVPLYYFGIVKLYKHHSVFASNACGDCP